MRVLLIQPPLTTRIYEKAERPTMYEPLGLGYLAAVARENGHEPAVLDCLAEGWRTQRKQGDLTRYGLTEEEIEARIRAFKPDIVGVTCMFSGFDRDSRDVAAIAKRACPEVPVVVGGADATAEAAELVEDPHIDLVVRGEGERVLIGLLEALEREGALPMDLPGTTIGTHDNPLADHIGDLDTLPFPARDLLPMDAYHEDQRPIMPYAKRRPIGFMMSSRGCPYKCIFCSTRNVWTGWRPRSPGNVVDEIEVLVKEYGVREVAFLDDSFIVKPERVRRICDEIQSRKLDIAWSVPVGLTVWRVDTDTLRAMRDCGFYRACFPIESGDPEMLKYIRKPVDLDRVLETIRACHDLGIWTYGNFLIGFPEQTPESVEKTAQFAESCGLDMINVYIVQPYKGAELWDIMQELGLLDIAQGTGSTIIDSDYDTKYFTADQLRAKRNEIYRRFTHKRFARLFTPRGVLDMLYKVNSPERFAYACRVATVFAKNSIVSRKFTIIPE